MVFEKLFFGEEKNKSHDEAEDELSESGKMRRNLLKGGAALMVSAAIPDVVKAADALPLEDEGKVEVPFETIEESLDYLKKMRSVFEDPTVSKQEILDVLHVLRAPTRERIAGSVYDHQERYRSTGSWPSVQTRKFGDEPMKIRFAHEANTEDGRYMLGANGFFLQDGEDVHFVTAGHVARKRDADYVYPSRFLDIAGCPKEELEKRGMVQEEDVRRVALPWDSRKVSEDLFGKLVHFTGIHELGGRDTPDNTDVISGYIFPAQEHYFSNPGSGNDTLFPEMTQADIEARYLKAIIEKEGDGANTPENREKARNYAEERMAIMKNGLIVFIPSRDTDGKNGATSSDVMGYSGSPFFLDEDAAKGKLVPSGILMGSASLPDSKREGVRYIVALVHGPEHIQALLNALSPTEEGERAEGKEREEAIFSFQQAFNAWARANRIQRIEEDGVWGEESRRAVYTIQLKAFGENGPYVPGELDRQTWELLLPSEEYVDIYATQVE